MYTVWMVNFVLNLVLLIAFLPIKWSATPNCQVYIKFCVIDPLFIYICKIYIYNIFNFKLTVQELWGWTLCSIKMFILVDQRWNHLKKLLLHKEFHTISWSQLLQEFKFKEHSWKILRSTVIMAIRVVEFSNGVYKIRKIFA